MFPQEAEWIAARLSALTAAQLTPLLDIGSSDRRYRTEKQPWIEQRIFAPLAARGVRIVFCDLKDSPGVDIVADLMTADGLDRLQAVGAMTVLCCNVLEHVPDARTFGGRLGRVVAPGGRLVVTVPHRYPHHNDPIDTMFRPSPEELSALFPDLKPEAATVLRTGTYRSEFARRPVTLFFRHLFRLPVPFFGFAKWKRSVGKLQYLVRPFEVTCAVLRRE